MGGWSPMPAPIYSLKTGTWRLAAPRADIGFLDAVVADGALPKRLALAVDLAAVPYGVNQQYLLSIERLIDHPKSPTLSL
jgi:hypothetical protein